MTRALLQSTHAADLSKYESEITMLRCDLIDKQAVMREVITAYDKAKADLADMTAQRNDLLAALRSLLKWGHVTATIYKAKAAIKKATGGQP
jgi:flagellar hook-basal body complex protein FliE